ncbi:MAG: hypothetical protein ACK4F7_08190 [Inhella sp.]
MSRITKTEQHFADGVRYALEYLRSCPMSDPGGAAIAYLSGWLKQKSPEVAKALNELAQALPEIERARAQARSLRTAVVDDVGTLQAPLQ